MKIKISVIVPLYRGKKYIPAIVDMLQKNLEKNREVIDLELILVNDFPDETIQNTSWKTKKEIDIKLICNQKNQGIHYSRICGLEQASGEYVLFLDQDDKIADNYFISQLGNIGENDVVVANGFAEYAEYDKLLYRFGFMQQTVKYIWFYTKFDCRIISPGQCLIKREVIPDIWKTRVMKKNGADDYFLWLILLSRKCKFAINREKLYRHIYTSVNFSSEKEKMVQSVREMLDISEGCVSTRNRERIMKRIEKKNDFVSVITLIIEKLNQEY